MTVDRSGNVLGALAVGLGDGLTRAAQRDVPESCPAAAIALAGHLPGLSIRQLSRALRLSHSATVRLVDRLADQGFVTRGRSTGDGRTAALMLTDRGAEVYTSVLGARRQYLEEVLSVLSPEERALYTDLTAKLLSQMIEKGENPLSVCRLCDVDACSDCPVEGQVLAAEQRPA